MEDATLVAGALAGRQECFEALVERHQRTVHGLAYRWLGDHAAADEVVQATFLQAYTHLVDFRGDASFRSWLCGIARQPGPHAYAGAAPRAHRVARRRARGGLPQPTSSVPAETSRGDLLARLVGRLPPRQRAVVTLRVVGDLPFREIARLEGISENSAKVSYHHAVTRLRQWLGRG